MPGTLHIFRLKTDPPEYQVNYNLGAYSYVQVMDAEDLDHFLRLPCALPESEVNALWDELKGRGSTNEAMIDIPEAHLGEMGFAESPSDE